MLTKKVRLTKKPESKGNFTAVSCVYDVYDKQNGKQPVWCSFVAFGFTGDKLAEMDKGAAVILSVKDIRPDSYQGNNGLSLSLKGAIVDFDYAEKRAEQPQQAPQQFAQPAQNFAGQQAPQQFAQPAPVNDGFDDSIPF